MDEAENDTVEPRFNQPLYNEILGITNDFLPPGQNYGKICGTEPPLKSSFSKEDKPPAHVKYPSIYKRINVSMW